MHHSVYRRPRGLTLIEVLVACVILSLGLVAISQLYIASMWTYKKARNLSLATQIAQFELEKIQNVGFATYYKALAHPGVTEDLLTNDGHYPLDDATNRAKYPGQQLYTNLTDGVGLSFAVEALKDYHGIGTIRVEHYTPTGIATTPENLIKVTIAIDWDGSPKAQTMVTVTTLLANQDVQLQTGGGE